MYFARRTQPWSGEIGSEKRKASLLQLVPPTRNRPIRHLLLFSVHSDEHAAHLATHKLPADGFFFHFSPMLFFKFANEAHVAYHVKLQYTPMDVYTKSIPTERITTLCLPHPHAPIARNQQSMKAHT
jgi:hypothetical protein